MSQPGFAFDAGATKLLAEQGAVLAYFLHVCSASPTIERGVSLAVRQSLMQDAAFYELSSMVEVCLPSSSSIHRQLSLV